MRKVNLAMLVTVSSLALACTVSSIANAQSKGALQRAQPDTGNARPQYPPMLRHAGVEGKVRVRFEIDTLGRIVKSTYKVLYADNELFMNSMRLATESWRYLPAQRDGRAVQDTVQVETVFEMGARDAWILQPDSIVVTATGPGLWRVLLSGPNALKLKDASSLDSAMQLAIAETVIDILLPKLISHNPSYPIRVACVALWARGALIEPTIAVLARIGNPKVLVLPLRRCPPSFGSFVRRETINGVEQKDPPGEDPFRVTIKSMRVAENGFVLVDTESVQALGGDAYRCVVTPDKSRPTGWVASCDHRYSIAH